MIIGSLHVVMAAAPVAVPVKAAVRQAGNRATRHLLPAARDDPAAPDGSRRIRSRHGAGCRSQPEKQRRPKPTSRGTTQTASAAAAAASTRTIPRSVSRSLTRSD